MGSTHTDFMNAAKKVIFQLGANKGGETCVKYMIRNEIEKPTKCLPCMSKILEK